MTKFLVKVGDTVTHSSTNRAQRRVTSLIETSALTATPTRQSKIGYFIGVNLHQGVENSASQLSLTLQVLVAVAQVHSELS